MTALLIEGGFIATLGETNRVLKDHTIVVEGDTIQAIVPSDTVTKSPGQRVVDAHGKVVMPGFINAHTHFYSAFATGLSKAEFSRDFHDVLKHLWWRLDKQLTLEDTYISAMLGCIDAVKHGATTVFDHHASPHAVTGSLAQVARAVTETGIRASLCYEVSDRDGPEIAEAGIQENVDFLSNGAAHDRLHGMFGLHASFTVGAETMKRAVEAAAGLNAGFHIHAAEDTIDQVVTINEHRANVIVRLNEAGVLGPQTICAHCVYINNEEMGLLHDSKTIVAHLPQSNMNNGVGALSFLKLYDAGLQICLGTDAMTADMRHELRTGIFLHRCEHHHPNRAFDEMTTVLLRNNAAVASRFWKRDIGVLAPGAAADLIVVDYDPPTPMNEESFLGHLVFGMHHAPVDTTVCAGRVLMQNRQLIGIDERAVKARARELSAALWERF
ncbi:MAG: putative aminohydrolase SsnA [Acidobacteriota bacterium]|nr:putative aminohydrolase SsnA [Acidobacteriota bacterium]